MGTNLTSIGITTNAIGFGSKASGGGVILPPELAAKIVCVCSAWGKNNNSSDRDIVKDKTGNGNDFLLSGFDYTIGSGYSPYATDYLKYTDNKGFVELDRTSTKLTMTNVSDIARMGIYQQLGVGKSYPIIPAHKVKITNLVKTLRWYYVDATTPTVVRSMQISSEGTYWLPASRNDLYSGEGAANVGFAFDAGGTVTIEQIPEFEGALVTDGIDDMIMSTKTISEMGITDKITVVSMIHQMGLSSVDNLGFTNYIRDLNNNNFIRNNIKDIDKTGIYGYNCSNIGEQTINRTVINNILGDKNDYIVTNYLSSFLESKFSVVGYGNKLELSRVAWYWTFIANDILTQDEINQVIAAYNLDNPGKVVKPQVYYNVAKQKINNDNHNEFGDKLLDYSGNGYDLQLNNFAWEGGSGVNSYPVTFGENKTWTYIRKSNGSAYDIEYSPNKIIVHKHEASTATIYSFVYQTATGVDVSREIPSFKIKVTGLEGAQYIRYLYISESNARTEVAIKTNGEYTLPKSYAYQVPETPPTDNLWIGFQVITVNNPNSNIAIEVLPIIEDALCLDGVDDYGKVSGLSILKDYTVVADYQRLSAKENSQDAPILSKSKIQGSGAFIFNFLSSSGNIVTYSFGANSTLGADDLKKNIYYQSKYINNGKSIIAGTAIDYSEMWLGTYRDNTSNCFNGAFYFSMLFPYSLSEFLLERQIKKLKAGTLYPGMVEWRPFIVANGEYSINHYEYTTDNVNWTTFNPGDYIPVGSTVVIWINTPNGNVDEVTSIKINGKDAPKYNYSEEYGYGFTYTVTTKIPQKINIYMDAYIAYEDIIHPYPSQVSLQYNSKKYTWGDKIKVGTQVTVSFANLLSDLCTVEGYKLNGEELTSSKVAIQKEMVFDYNTVNWNLQAPLFVYNPALIKLNNTGLKRLQKLPDISGNRNDLLLYNMTFEPNSGLGEYRVDYKNTWSNPSGRATIELKERGFTLLANSTSTNFLEINSKNKTVPSHKVRVTGVSTIKNGSLKYSYTIIENGVESTRVFDNITKDGDYELPAIIKTERQLYGGWYLSNGINSSMNVTVEEIPSDTEGLYFDGVTDYGTIPTLTAGGKSLLMKINNKTLGTIVYDQRNHSVEDAPFALSTGSDTTAYNYRNPNGTTYLDNLVNSNVRGNKLVDVPSVVTMSNDLVTTENSASPCIGKSRAGSSAYYSQFALYNSVLFPEVLSDADRAKINEWSGITGNFIKFNPVVTSNIPYNRVLFFDVETSQAISGFPKALLKGQQVQLNIQVKDNELNEVSKVIVNGVELELYSKDEECARYRFTVEETQVIDITIDEYIRYEDIKQPYPILFNLTDKDNPDKVYTYGDKIKLNSIIKVKSVTNKVINLYSIHGYLINDDPTVYSYSQVKDADILVIKNLTFNCNRNWLLSSVPEPLYIYDPSMINNTGLKNLGYLPDMTGRGNHLVLNSFAYSKSSGKDGYLYDFPSLHSNIEVISVDSSSMVVNRKTGDQSWCVMFPKDNLTRSFRLYFSRYDSDEAFTASFIATKGGTTAVSRITLKPGWNTITPTDPDTFDIYYIAISSTGTFLIQQEGIYPGALCFDGIDDYGTVPTLDYGGKSLFMKVNWDTYSRFVYDQRATVNIYDLAVYIHSQPEGTKIPAYQVRNQNGYTYIDGVLNKYIIPDNLADKTHVFEAGNAETTNDNSATPNIGRAVSGQSYAKMAMYKTMLLPEIPNDEDRAIINDWCGIEGGYVKKPSYYWDVYGKTNSTTDEADPHTQIKEQVRWQQGISQSNMFLRNNNFAYEGMSGYGGYPVVFGSNKTWVNNGYNNGAVYSPNKITLSKIDIANAICYTYVTDVNGTLKEFSSIPSFKVKVTGLSDDIVLNYRYLKQGTTFVNIQRLVNGINELPMSYSSTEVNISDGYQFIGFTATPNKDSVNITIEILPEYPNGLVFDGIDDYLFNEIIPMFTDYTLLIKAEQLINSNTGGCIVRKGKIGNIIPGGYDFIYGLKLANGEDNENSYWSYGKSIIYSDMPLVGYMTKTNINGTEIIPGDNPSIEGITVGAWSNYASMVFYKLMLYPKTIDMLSINMVKNMFETDGIIDLSNKLFDTTVSRDFSNDFNNDFNN